MWRATSWPKGGNGRPVYRCLAGHGPGCFMRLGGPGAAINKAVAAELLVGGRVVDSDLGCRHKCRPAGVSAPEGGSAQVP